MSSDKTREQFEAWAATKRMALHLGRGESGLYVSPVTQNYMDCWLASRAAVVVELPLTRISQGEKAGDSVPKRAALMANHLAIEECRQAIENAGLQVKP